MQAIYGWLADGIKIGVRDAAGTPGYEYVGSLVYKYVNGELQLESTGFGGGRLIVSEGTSGVVYTPAYYLTDHLGSARVVLKFNAGDVDVVERSDFILSARNIPILHGVIRRRVSTVTVFRARKTRNPWAFLSRTSAPGCTTVK